jgi:hypothetical protein
VQLLIQFFLGYYVEDASYLRIQNIQLGYTLNSRFLKSRITKLRLYTAVKISIRLQNTEVLIRASMGLNWWDLIMVSILLEPIYLG